MFTAPHLSNVTYHVSYVTCQVTLESMYIYYYFVSVLVFFLLLIFFGQIVEASRRRVCHRQGLPGLVLSQNK